MSMTLLMTAKSVRRKSLVKEIENQKGGRDAGGREAGETFIAVRVRKGGALSRGS